MNNAANNAANYTTASDAFVGWSDSVMTGKPPIFYPISDTGNLSRIEIGPGLVTLLGGAPGAGKTAFTMQATFDALRINRELRAMICNIEMTPAVLLDRQLSRLSGIDLTEIRYRRLGAEHAERLKFGMDSLAAIADRLAFVRAPFDLLSTIRAAKAFGANMVVLDYIQRIPPPPEPGEREGKRESIDANMNYLRQLADEGMAVVVVSAVSRGKDSKGRTSYAGDSLNLASFRESSELEFGADDAFILTTNEKDANEITLKHLKARHTEARNVVMHFNRKCQQFTEVGATNAATRKPRSVKPLADSTPVNRGGKVQSDLLAAWSKMSTAAGLPGVPAPSADIMATLAAEWDATEPSADDRGAA